LLASFKKFYKKQKSFGIPYGVLTKSAHIMDTVLEVILLNRNAKKQIENFRNKGYTIIDVTSKSNSEYVKFSPFYPHGNIPIPGISDLFADSVEGIWQGLKQFENGGTDYSKFFIRNMKNIKRSCRKYGRVLGHKFNDGILDYCEARKHIYIPSYTWVLEKKLRVELFSIIEKSNKIVLLDYTTNENIEDLRKPLSHASLIKKYLLKYDGD